MKRTRNLRTLEELWAIEDQHPLTGSNPAGLMRWMYATGLLNGRSRPKVARSRHDLACSQNGKRTAPPG